MSKSLRTLVFYLVVGAACGAALASDSDLQQYAGTSTWFSDLTTAPTLLPRDGKRITADNNGANSAPVNRSLKQLKDYLVGLQDGIVGSRAGSQLRTLRSVQVDGIGGALSSVSDGDIQASNNITSLAGDVTALTGKMTASGRIESDSGSLVAGTPLVPFSPYSEHTITRFLYANVGSTMTDANPPVGTLIANQLRAINIPKVSAFLETDCASGVTVGDGYGVGVVSVDSGTGNIVVNFLIAFTNTKFTVKPGSINLGGAAYLIMEDVANRTSTSIRLRALNTTTNTFVDFTSCGFGTSFKFSVDIDGRQTT